MTLGEPSPAPPRNDGLTMAPRSGRPCGMQNGIASSLALFAMTSLTSRHTSDRDPLMTRIAVGGFLHETNTFAPTKATYADFVHGGGWPAMAQDADVLKVMRNINVGLAGFVEAAEARGWELVPTISCGASPSAHVTEDAFERIVKVIVDGIAAAGPLDAVYLDLHGAMVTEHLDDGEGEILRACAPGDRQGSAAGGQPRSARQRDARDGGACGRTDRLSHLSACRHGRHRPRLAPNIWRCCSAPGRNSPRRSGSCRS